ncbi:MAG: folylpolyglutamate synthase/dihydrofolate synthase family protein [bacterium]
MIKNCNMTYPQVLDYLSASEHLGIKLGLSNIKKLLRASGIGDEKFRIIHITGTNGKGSVAIFLSSILKQAGFRVGLYTSPHLVDFRERIQVDGKYISKRKASELLSQLLFLIRTSRAKFSLEPTYFEIMTALALQYFSQANVEIAILEVGMGGRLDATNVFKHSLVSIITNINHEHTDYLGKRISDISREKAGIIKKNGIVITGVKQKGALEIIKGVCQKKKTRLFCLGKDIKVQQINQRRNADNLYDFQMFNYQGIFDSFRDLKIKLLGRHQMENAALALGAIEALRLRGIQVAENHLRKGLENAIWPGRLEVMNYVNGKGENCRVVLDGAHNPAAMRSLKNALLEGVIPHRRIILVLGILKDKDVRKMVPEIVPLCQEAMVTSPNTERGLDKNLLRREVVNYLPSGRVRVENDVGEALMRALEIAGRDDLICVTGSFYTVGEARRALKR